MPIPSAQEEYRSSWAARVLLRWRHLGKLLMRPSKIGDAEKNFGEIDPENLQRVPIIVVRTPNV
jgi:hypothetical protein